MVSIKSKKCSGKLYFTTARYEVHHPQYVGLVSIYKELGFRGSTDGLCIEIDLRPVNRATTSEGWQFPNREESWTTLMTAHILPLWTSVQNICSFLLTCSFMKLLELLSQIISTDKSLTWIWKCLSIFSAYDIRTFMDWFRALKSWIYGFVLHLKSGSNLLISVETSFTVCDKQDILHSKKSAHTTCTSQSSVDEISIEIEGIIEMRIQDRKEILWFHPLKKMNVYK